MSKIEHVRRLGRIDAQLQVALYESIQDSDWALEKRSRFFAPIQGMYLIRPDVPGDSYELWPRIAPLALEMVESVRPMLGNMELSQIVICKLPPQSGVRTHVDHWMPQTCRRAHVPLRTNPHVQFTVAGRDYTMEEGWAYEIDHTSHPHSVRNDSATEERVHLLFDLVER